MKSAKLWIPIAAGSTMLVLMGAFCFLQNDQVETGEFASKKSQRPLELSKASAKSKPKEESQVLLNDPAISQAWGLKKSDAQKAWEVSQGDKSIIVAVIDTGIDAKHEDLKNNLWTDPENPGVHGWNFVSNNSDLTDNHGHGTHIAGIIGAEAGNGKGIAGISPKVQLMILKYFDPKVPNTDNLKNTVAAIRYAVKKGAKIINYSGGGTEYSQEEKDAIEEARKAGVLFVAAAGNERSNSDHHKYYPADYGLSNIISVTAIDPSTEVLPSSNYGVETVDIAAPGQNILSTLQNNAYGYMTGTSQATAFVTGAAVLVMARHKEFAAEEVKKYILSTGDSQSSLLAKTRTSRQLNLYKAITMMDSTALISGLVASNLPVNVGITQDPAASTKGEGVREIATFGKSLLDVLQADEAGKN